MRYRAEISVRTTPTSEWGVAVAPDGRTLYTQLFKSASYLPPSGSTDPGCTKAFALGRR